MESNSYYIAEINSFNEYIEFIREIYKTKQYEIWYRGQSSNEWDLKPNLYRDAIRCTDSLILRYDFVNFKNEFIKLKDDIVEKNLFDISTLNNFQIMFIAQHYGLLTPILDWTTDPLVALFFALEDYKAEEEAFPVIYILKPGLCNKHSAINYTDGRKLTNPLCIDDNIICLDEWIEDLNNTPANHVPIAIFSKMDFSHRICKQSGKFTFHGAVGPINYAWNNITIEGEKFADIIKISPEAVAEMKEYLLALDITKESIYRDASDLDIACKEIKEEALGEFKSNIAKVNEKINIDKSCKNYML